jgi:hypothetical protein
MLNVIAASDSESHCGNGVSDICLLVNVGRIERSVNPAAGHRRDHGGVPRLADSASCDVPWLTDKTGPLDQDGNNVACENTTTAGGIRITTDTSGQHAHCRCEPPELRPQNRDTVAGFGRLIGFLCLLMFYLWMRANRGTECCRRTQDSASQHN